MPGYQFYCHEQIRNELARNTIEILMSVQYVEWFENSVNL